jgi:hypothetical protein
MKEVNKNIELNDTDKKLHISDVIPRYKFGTYHIDNETHEYDWFIIDTHTDKVVENLKDKELHDVRQRCGEWNDNVV